MSLIQTVHPDDAQGQVADIYEQIEGAMGHVPQVMQMYSGSPWLLANQWDGIKYYRGHKSLSPALLAMVRMLVSQENECEYCVGFNAGMLINHLGFTPEQIAATKRDPRQAPLPDKDRAMLELVLKATSTPKAVTSADLDRLRKLGWSDADMLDAVAHGTRNMMVDVILNTFKVDNDVLKEAV